MDELCSQLSSLSVSMGMLLNIDTWQNEQLNSRGIYKELITSHKIYEIYSHGEIFTTNNLGYVKVKELKLIEQDGDIMVLASYY